MFALKCYECDSAINLDCGETFNITNVPESYYADCKATEGKRSATCYKVVSDMRKQWNQYFVAII